MCRRTSPARTSGEYILICGQRISQWFSHRRYLIYIIVLVGLSINWAGICYLHFKSSPGPLNTEAFLSFAEGSDKYGDFDGVWRLRIFSNYFASFFVTKNSPIESLAKGVGQWSAFWFALCGLVYMLWEKRFWLVMIFGTFGALCYGFMPPSGYRLYPWDMPAMFFYCLLFLICRYRWPLPALSIVILGSGFKETIAICSVVFLFWESLSIGKRISLLMAAIGGCILLRVLIDVFIVGGTVHTFLGLVDRMPLELFDNMRRFLSKTWFHPLLINSGTLLIFFLLPTKDRDDLMWKTVTLIFLAIVMIGGIVTEYRIFWELIPLSMARIAKEWSAQPPHFL